GAASAGRLLGARQRGGRGRRAHHRGARQARGSEVRRRPAAQRRGVRTADGPVARRVSGGREGVLTAEETVVPGEPVVTTPGEVRAGPTRPLGTVVIAGVGLIGGSVGLGIRQRALAAKVIGYDSAPAVLEAAVRLGVVAARG